MMGMDCQGPKRSQRAPVTRTIRDKGLLSTKLVGWVFKDAEALLSKKAAWKAGCKSRQRRTLLRAAVFGGALQAVDEHTRKECFEIFVDHLATHTGQAVHGHLLHLAA